VDGLPVPDLHARCTAVVKGDSLSVSIAAASILAKVTRDRQMALADELYPAYGFGKHKGYAAATHLEAIQKHGACPIHRLSFRPFSQQVLHFEDEPTSAG
jgi:ribonuclease HII